MEGSGRREAPVADSGSRLLEALQDGDGLDLADGRQRADLGGDEGVERREVAAGDGYQQVCGPGDGGGEGGLGL